VHWPRDWWWPADSELLCTAAARLRSLAFCPRVVAAGLDWREGSAGAQTCTQERPERDTISPVVWRLGRGRPGPWRRSNSTPPSARSCARPKASVRVIILEHTEAQGSVRRQQRQCVGCWHSGHSGQGSQIKVQRKQQRSDVVPQRKGQAQ
jgi:hypothetical protein